MRGADLAGYEERLAFALTRGRAACAAAPHALPPADRDLLDALLLGELDLDLRRLAAMCGRLGRMAGRQLAGEELTDEDLSHLAGLGEEVAHLHGYRGHSYLHPADDHPRITAVGLQRERDLLQVGVARPEPLYVILDTGGRPTLFLGAVLSYREQLGGAMWRTGDWRERAARGRAPDPPAFTASFRR